MSLWSEQPIALTHQPVPSVQTYDASAARQSPTSRRLPETVHHLLLVTLIFYTPPQLVDMLRRHAIRARLPLHTRSAPIPVPSLALRHLATATSAPSLSSTDIFANGTNAYYAEEMYRHWRQDPKSVHASWDAYFSGLERGMPSQQIFQPAPGTVIARPADGSPKLHGQAGQELNDHLKV